MEASADSTFFSNATAHEDAYTTSNFSADVAQTLGQMGDCTAKKRGNGITVTTSDSLP